MQFIGRSAKLTGAVDVPGSKSHTIRAVAIASLAAGDSVIRCPLESNDASSAVAAYRALGATIDCGPQAWYVRGVAANPRPPENIIDVGNSGTTLRLAVGSAGLLDRGMAVFTGDDQIRRRGLGPLLESLKQLGAFAATTRNNSCAPAVVGPRLRGGKTALEAVTSQYLSSLLVNCPLAERDTEIEVTLLNEAPYVLLTLAWLDGQGIAYERDELRRFRIRGGQSYQGFDRRVPGDFASATFFLAAGALGDNDVLVRGLDLNDSQGDKRVLDYLRQMGARVEVEPGGVRVHGTELTGCDIDMNATPDALPMFAVIGCLARGTTRLLNVPQARVKETDRIAVMAAELRKLGGRVEELADGLVLHQSCLRAGDVCGHGDHRVVMALAIASTAIDGPRPMTIDTAEAMNVTFPTFLGCLRGLGAEAELRP